MQKIPDPPEDPKNVTASATVLRWSVGDFVSFVYRRGGLRSGSFSASAENAGVKIHQQYFSRFQKTFQDGTLLIEYPLKTVYSIPPVRFEIQGRADLITESPEKKIHIVEIKSIQSDSETLPQQVDFLHAAQARIYAYLYSLEKEDPSAFAEIEVTVKYILAKSFQIRDFNETLSFCELEDFFRKTCEYYLEWGISIHDYRLARDASIKALPFPYPELRQGQKEFMRTVLETVRKREPLLVQAPTGTGKTISVLYPAIKSIPKQYSDYIFYLTAKTSTQDVAKKTLEDLRGQGLVVKSIVLTAKEKICLCSELYCDQTLCPYATHYYEHSSEAMKALSGVFAVDSAHLSEIGEKYNVCPFELGLDLSLFCDVIICDYNYLYDPKVQLERFAAEDSYRFTILMDEAHNLPDRANEMYSAELMWKELQEAKSAERAYSVPAREALGKLSSYFEKMFETMSRAGESDLSGESSSFDSSLPPKEMYLSADFCASRKKPKELLSALDQWIRAAKDEMDLVQDDTAKNAMKDLFFSAKFFQRVADEFFSDSYITTFSREGKNAEICLRCMDSSRQIAKVYQGRHAAVFFSATLSPLPYFENKFRDPRSSEPLRSFVLPSPFPRENLLVGIVPGVSTKYRQRRDSLGMVLDVIDAAVFSKTGNYIIFSPSFEYQQWLVSSFEMIAGSRRSEIKPFQIIRQTPHMSEKNRRAFLNEFREYGKRTLLAFAVIGGVFSEGIDLVGETLSGVVLVGVGLPKKTPERDIMMDYYSSILGNGFNFAYRYPGFNKILQAAGRVIRSESDRGFILLLDERYETPDYQSLFPEEWRPVLLKNKNQIRQVLREFWGDDPQG